MLSGGDGPRHSLHASAEYREYNEDAIFYLSQSTTHPYVGGNKQVGRHQARMERRKTRSQKSEAAEFCPGHNCTETDFLAM